MRWYNLPIHAHKIHPPKSQYILALCYVVCSLLAEKLPSNFTHPSNSREGDKSDVGRMSYRTKTSLRKNIYMLKDFAN